jgi:hypothetical protein
MAVRASNYENKPTAPQTRRATEAFTVLLDQSSVHVSNKSVLAQILADVYGVNAEKQEDYGYVLELLKRIHATAEGKERVDVSGFFEVL